jgi:putative ABC transport system permease protein
MTGLLSALRGLAHQAGISLSILLVAVVAVAAVTVGPAYYAATQSSILQDTVNQAGVAGRGFEINQSGPVDAIDSVTAEVGSLLAHYAGGQATAKRLFTGPVTAAETTVQAAGQTVPLVYRSGVCAHLRFTAGRCPVGPRQVAVSTSLAFLLHWHLGQRIAVPTWKRLVITGVYRITPAASGASYWFGAGSRYFPYENESGPNPPPNIYDAMFTPVATLATVPGKVQGTDYVDFWLASRQLTGTDVPVVASAMRDLVFSPQLQQTGATTTTSIPATLGTVRASWRAVEVPVVLITAQLLILAWLLLFLIVADAAEARGPEVALAKMRGRGRLRTLTFGLAEPVILLAIALPAGLLAGWAMTNGLAHILLRPGTPVGLPTTALLAAAVATAGGLAAVVVAARRTLRRPVVEQWQRASRVAAQRGWVVDSILITAALAGLIELRVSGQIGSAHRGVLGLLLPGLLGVAIAVAGSRLLILVCRAGFRSTQRSGRIGPFLALRHIARRPGGMRTTIVLGTAFALASFAVGIWSVTVANIRQVADAEVGAATVLAVTPPAGHTLASIVDRIDPGGRQAMAVDEYTTSSGSAAGQVMVGVDPQRFARIAAWRPSWADQPVGQLAAALDPPAPPAVMLTGDQVRIRFTASHVRPAHSTLILDLYQTGVAAIGQSPLYFGPASGSRSVVQPLTGCPCQLANLTVSAPPPGPGASTITPRPVTGSVTVTSIEVRSRGGRWNPVNAGLSTPGHWQPGGNGGAAASSVHPGPGGLRWTFRRAPGVNPVAVSVNRPYPVPALIPRAAAPGGADRVQVAGLDGNPLYVHAVALPAAIPGAPGNGILVDRDYAERAAGGTPAYASQQVWLAPGALGRIQPALRAAGVRIDGVTSAASVRARLGRQGPALATVLFLADALAAAVLATGAAVIGLYASARRRRYEYAALIASRVSRGAIRASLLTEQAAVLGFGAIIGLASGLVATLIAARSIPEFISQPLAPPLRYLPSAADLAVLAGVVLVGGALAVVIASLLLVRSVQPDLLREGEP